MHRQVNAEMARTSLKSQFQAKSALIRWHGLCDSPNKPLVMRAAIMPLGGHSICILSQHLSGGSVLVPASTEDTVGGMKTVSSVALGLSERFGTTWSIWSMLRCDCPWDTRSSLKQTSDKWFQKAAFLGVDGYHRGKTVLLANVKEACLSHQ